MLIFVCGKSGSGKSTFAKLVADKLNYKYFDVDEVAHDFYNQPQFPSKMQELFGEGVFDEKGFNRKKLGEIVFSRPEDEAVREYNNLSYEFIKNRLSSFLHEKAVVDWLLLPRTQLWDCNALKILIKSRDDKIRKERILQRDKITEEYLQLRERASVDYNEDEFDCTIYNDYDINFEKMAEKVAQKIRKKTTIRILGTQSPFSNKESACPSYLIASGDKKLILDCGSGSHRFFDMRNLENLNIIISHLHKDHFNDLPNYQYSSLVMHRQNFLNEKINIYLPEISSQTSQLLISEKDAYCNYFGIDEKSKFNIGEFEIDFLKVAHAQGVATFATRIKTKGKTIIYSADISYSSKAEFVKFAQNADILICEASFLKTHGFPEICNHLTAFQAGSIAKEARVKKLVLTHLWAFEDINNYLKESKTAFDNTVIAKEEKEFYLL